MDNQQSLEKKGPVELDSGDGYGVSAAEDAKLTRAVLWKLDTRCVWLKISRRLRY